MDISVKKMKQVQDPQARSVPSVIIAQMVSKLLVIQIQVSIRIKLVKVNAKLAQLDTNVMLKPYTSVEQINIAHTEQVIRYHVEMESIL